MVCDLIHQFVQWLRERYPDKLSDVESYFESENLEAQLESILNEWTGQGWSLDSMQFAMRDSSRRPCMAFITFTRDNGQ